MKTYIIKTKAVEYYCGKTNNTLKRFYEHMNEIKPHWFSFKDRKQVDNMKVIDGDFEKQIKRAGVKLIYDIIEGSAS